MNALNISCPHCFVTNRLSNAKLANTPKCGKCHEQLFVGSPLAVNDEQLEKVIRFTDVPVIVDFWAEWCGPCKMFAPTYATAAGQLEPDFRLLKLDTEHNQESGSRYNIRSIPTLALFKGGKEIARQSGAMPLSALVDWVRSKA